MTDPVPGSAEPAQRPVTPCAPTDSTGMTEPAGTPEPRTTPEPHATSVPGATPVPAATIERAMAGLDGLANRPLAEHVDAFERVHVALGEALATGSA